MAISDSVNRTGGGRTVVGPHHEENDNLERRGRTSPPVTTSSPEPGNASFPSTAPEAVSDLGGAEEVNANMDYDYDWFEQRDRDPIVTDTNLAEIDFEDFRNEDLAYAFSCGEEESGSSGTDMSICRSEVLFSSMKGSGDPNLLFKIGAPSVQGQSLLIQDSLINMSFTEQVKVNKNNYTLTFSGNGGGEASIAGSMVLSDAGHLRDPDLDGTKSPNTLTTWSNVGRQGHQTRAKEEEPMPVQKPERWRSRRKEENSINNNSGSNDSTRKSRSLPDFKRDKTATDHERQKTTFAAVAANNSEGKAPGTFVRVQSSSSGDAPRHVEHRFSWPHGCHQSNDDVPLKQAADSIPMMRSKDTVNNFLKTASKLTSIDEVSGETFSTSSTTSTGSNNNNNNTTTVPGEAARLSSEKVGRKEQRDKVEVVPESTVREDTLASVAKRNKGFPDLSFLENEIGLWDAFFLYGKNSRSHKSVLNPASLPVEGYMKDQCHRRDRSARNQRGTRTYSLPQQHLVLRDSESLRTLLPSAHRHLIGPGPLHRNDDVGGDSPITQVCESMSRLHVANRHAEHDLQNQAIKSMFGQRLQQHGDGVQVVRVKEAWAAVPETAVTSEDCPGVVRRRRGKSGSEGRSGEGYESARDLSAKRRSYHPQDHLSKMMIPEPNVARRTRRDVPKSGSQNDLCDSWAADEDAEPSRTASCERTHDPCLKPCSAEYPFQANMWMPPQGINFDLTRKRGLFVNLYTAVERLLGHQETADSNDTASARCILFQELCPALQEIMADGLKPEVITSFGRMPTSVWRVVEAVTQQGPSTGTSTCDLVMLLNTRFGSTSLDEDHRKFSGFVAGLINMSCLHIWFSKLKWSMDVLLRFYERHSYICALHRETKLLFDELVFCLQRLYTVPIYIDLALDSCTLDAFQSCCNKRACRRSFNGCHCWDQGCRSACASCAGISRSGGSGRTSEGTTPTSDSAGRSDTSGSRRTSSSAKSRIPRPVSLPKRLESKLKSQKKSPSSGTDTSGFLSGEAVTKRGRTVSVNDKVLKSPGGIKPALTPVSSGSSARKSRVRETIRLFDAKSIGRPSRRSTAHSGIRNSSKRSPVTGGGEGMAPHY